MPLLAGCGLFIVENVLKKLNKRDNMLSISRMPMNWRVDDIIQHLKKHNESYNPEVAEMIRQRKSKVTTKEFYELLNFKNYEDIDIYEDEGVSIVHDLNTPLPKEYHQQFDYVSEVGTIEHIFDLKTVMHNISLALKPGGVVCHISPLDAYNHGFYNFSFNFFYDFYRANGFDEMESYLLRFDKNWHKNQNILVSPFPYTNEEFHINEQIYASQHNKLGVGFIAVKKAHMEDVVVPMQGSYDSTRKLKGLRDWG